MPEVPFACRWLIRLAGWLVPRRERQDWSRRWYAGARDWWILVERGELTRGASREFFGHCRRAFADAFWRRFSREGLRHWVRAASFPLAIAAVLLALAGLLSRGFAITRALIRTIPHLDGLPPFKGEEFVIAHGVPVAFALATAVVLVRVSGTPIFRHGARYWAYFVVKSAAAMALTTVVWIEGGAAIRGMFRSPMWAAFWGGLVMALVYVFAFARALLWAFDDQRRRCPVCLRLLAMPVSMGSWASVLEPVTTELMCDEGHGSLAVAESHLGEADRWISLDASWRELFERERGARV